MATEQVQDDERTPGERLGELLHELRYTQTALAERCGVSPQYVNNIVRGRQRMTEDFAQALARTLDANLNWLYLGRGEMLCHDEAEVSNAVEKGPVRDLRQAAKSLQSAANQLMERRRSETGT